MTSNASFFVAAVFWIGSVNALAQNAPNVSQVLMYSTVTNTNIGPQFSQNLNGGGTNLSGSLPHSLFSIYRVQSNDPGNLAAFQTSPTALNSAISSAIGVALALIPVASPTSATINKIESTGAQNGPGTLGPILTERAETIGKHRWFLGISYQDFHFTSINGKSLNGLSILYAGGEPTGFKAGSGRTTSAPMTFNVGLDVRLSQSLAFFTYGLTDRVDISVGIPMVHSAVAATAYNAQVFTGDGLGGGGTQPGSNCWCMNSLSPATFQTSQAYIGQSALAKTGVGDLLVRVKGAVIDTSRGVVSVGTDLRFATGDASNYLGTGTTTVKPFLAASLASKASNGIVFSPHFNIGWQFSGKSQLGGALNGSPQTANVSGVQVPYFGAPLIVTKDYLPDVLQASIGAEVALRSRSTVVVDLIGNEIGMIHGAATVHQDSQPGFSPFGPFAPANAVGMDDGGRTSFKQFSGAFGYKARITRNLVAAFNALVRFDNRSLTARFVPLYGLSYTF